MIVIIICTILFFLVWGLVCMLQEMSKNQRLAGRSSNSNSMRSSKTTSIYGGTTYLDSVLNHDFKRTSRPTFHPYSSDPANDKLVCKICGYETTGFNYDTAVNTLMKQVNSSEFETMRILEDKEYRERLRKKYKL